MSARGDSDRVQVQLGVEPVHGSPLPEPDTPFRIALLGDFSARGSRAGAAARPLASRRLVPVDRDDLDDALARIAPELHVGVGEAGAAEVLAVTELDHLHPDSLYDRLASLGALRALRKRVLDPATSRQAIRQLLGSSDEAPSGVRPAAAVPTGASLLEQIVTEVAGPAPEGSRVQPAAVDGLTKFIRQAVAGHIVDPGDPRQADVLEGLEAALAGRMRAVLHDPGFQELEALWRGVQLLVRRLETGTDLKLYLLDITRDELAADLTGDVAPESSDLCRLLTEQGVGAPWGVLVGCYDFGPVPEDVALLGRVGEIARAAGAPWLSAARPPLAGYPSFEAIPEAEDFSAPECPEWDELRRQAGARWLGLVAPRVLLRLPYGADGEECERFAFEELGPSPEHGEFLWGNGALAAALLLGESFTADGWSLRPGSRTNVTGLPLHIVRPRGEARTVPCAEALMPERTADLMLEAGIMPLASLKDRDAVHLVRFQSVAQPLAALAGSWQGAR